MSKFGLTLVGILVVCVLAGVAFGVGGDMGIGTDPLTDGSADYPWLIEDVNDFNEFADPNNSAIYWASGVHTKLMCDIGLDPNLPGRQTYTNAVIAQDLNSEGMGFQGIQYDGVFSGNSHAISNLIIDTEVDFAGLFGEIGSSGLVKNIFLENVSITCGDEVGHSGGLCGGSRGVIQSCFVTGSIIGGDDSDYLGGLCGENRGIISNCYASGNVAGGDGASSLGGLCGHNYFATIIHSRSSVSITGDFALGSLCGDNHLGIISNCKASGDITGDDYLGGLCGHNFGNISNCYATGFVTGSINSHHLGGLCGYNSNDSSISNCYSTGIVTGEENIGGLCGTNTGGSISNCFWDVQTSGMTDGVGDQDPDPSGVIGRTTVQMQTGSTFYNANWDFVDETVNGTCQIWQMPTGGGYPVLSHFNGYIPEVLAGNGSEDSPYLISNAAELGAVYHYNSNDCFMLQSDIDLSGIQWSTAVVPVINGYFDGGGHTIYNLSIEGGGYLGLFSKISGFSAEVRDLEIVDANIIGGDDTGCLGILCGFNDKGTISNCYTSGYVAGGVHASGVGGLCGYNFGGTISNCRANGDVAGGTFSESLGGLCGKHYGTNVSGYIDNCYASVNVTDEYYSAYLGGLCGYNSGGTISNSNASGYVTGGENTVSLGGLCGRNSGGISNCWASGAMMGDFYAGGLCGSSSGEIDNSYAIGSVTGGDYSGFFGGLCALNSGDISNCWASGTVTGGDPSHSLGGLCGWNYDGTISNCFWDIQTSGMALGYNLAWDKPGTITNVVGKTTAEMQTKSTFTDAGWDFVDIWDICDGLGYPRLQWQILAGDFVCPYGVNLVDFAVLAERWGLSDGQPGYDEMYDLDGTGIVDVFDIMIMADNWLKSTDGSLCMLREIGDTEVFGGTTTVTDRRAMPYTMTETGTIESVSMYHEAGTGGDMILAVYDDVGGEPSTLIGVTASTPVSAGAGWQTIDIAVPVEVLSGETIWLAWVYQNNPGIRYEAGTPGRASSGTGWAGGMPEAFGSSSLDDWIYSIYAAYSRY